MTREARERLLTGLSCVLPGRAALTLTPWRPDVRTHMSLAVWVIGVVVALVALIWLARKFADRLARPIAPSEASRRWADRLRRIVEVDPLACIRCGGTMRIVACITDRAVLDRILTQLQTRATLARTHGPCGPPERRASLQQRPLHAPATAAASSPVSAGFRPRRIHRGCVACPDVGAGAAQRRLKRVVPRNTVCDGSAWRTLAPLGTPSASPRRGALRAWPSCTRGGTVQFPIRSRRPTRPR